MTFANTFKSTLAAAVACLALALTPNPAAASTATTTFTVSASVTATCLISATTLSFGNYAFAATPASSTISVTCTNGTTYNVGLNAGLASGATVTSRQMAGTVAGSLLNYGLFKDSGHATNWGDTVGTDTVAGTGNGAAQSLTVYGQIPATQYVAPGSYSDTITATITY
jgi:spore coat protein U-like protein